MLPRTVRPTGVLAGLLLVGTLALAGCGGDDDSTDAGPGDAASSSAAAGDGGDQADGSGDATDGNGDQSTDDQSDQSDGPPLPKAPDVTKAVGAAGDLRWKASSCGLEQGQQVVRGRVANGTRKKQSYAVTLSWLADATVVGRGSAVVRDVPPGGSAGWKVTAKVRDDATQCVPNVLRGTIAAD